MSSREAFFLNEKVVGLPVFHGVLFLLCWAALRGSDRNIVALLDAMDPQDGMLLIVKQNLEGSTLFITILHSALFNIARSSENSS